MRANKLPAAKTAVRTMALRIREISVEKAKYEKLAAKCSAEAKKLRDLHEMQATVSALGHLNRIMRRADTDSLMRGAENAVADGEGASATIDGIGQLLGNDQALSSIDVDEDELMHELEMIAGTAAVTSPPEEVGMPMSTGPKSVASSEYMRQLLGQTN